MPFGSVYEDDRDLDDPAALPPGSKAHLDLKRVAVGPHGVEVDRGEHGPAKALEATGCIPKRQASYGPCIYIGKVAEKQTADGPIHDGDLPLPIARTKHKVGLLDGAK